MSNGRIVGILVSSHPQSSLISASIVPPHAPRIAGALPPHPGSRVIVPVVFAVAKHAGRLTQATHATMPVDSRQYRLPHKRAAAPLAGDRVYFSDDRIVKFDVHSHVYIDNTKNSTKTMMPSALQQTQKDIAALTPLRRKRHGAPHVCAQVRRGAGVRCNSGSRMGTQSSIIPKLICSALSTRVIVEVGSLPIRFTNRRRSIERI